jgi:hydrogenase nickel incorporation protein HypB
MAEIISEEISLSLLKANEAIAKELRDFFNKNKIFTVNIMSSPGAGKTTFLENISEYFDKQKICVFVGDIQTERDAKRINSKGIKAFQIVTQGTCHLEAIMIKQAIKFIPEKTDYLFIENVGNLVCPASYDLGEHLKITLLSVTEGDDKILKYPKAFLKADVLLINKVDLLPYVEFDVEKVEEEAKKVNRSVNTFKISALKRENLKEVADFIRKKREIFFSNFNDK